MSAPNTQALCNLCRQRPKSGTHDFCGKNCASKAATLCAHCYKRPKYSNSDYCGKTCRDAAQGSSVGRGKPKGGQSGTNFSQGANPPKVTTATTLCTYCSQRPKYSGSDYCGKTCRDAAKGSAAGGGQSGGGQNGSWLSMAANQVKAVTGLGANAQGYAPTPPTSPTQGPPASSWTGPPTQGPPASSWTGPPTQAPPAASWAGAPTQAPPAPSWTAPQKPQGSKPNNSASNMGAANFPPAVSQGPNISAHASQRKPLSAGAGGPQPPQAATPTLPTPDDEDPMDDANDDLLDYPEEDEDPVDLCIMCRRAPQRYEDFFCGMACKKNAMKKQ